MSRVHSSNQYGITYLCGDPEGYATGGPTMTTFLFLIGVKMV